jgi:tellurite resistance protein
MTIWTAQDSLVAVMITTSAADGSMSASELLSIERIVGAMPAFANYDPDRIRGSTCCPRKTASTPF